MASCSAALCLGVKSRYIRAGETGSRGSAAVPLRSRYLPGVYGISEGAKVFQPPDDTCSRLLFCIPFHDTIRIPEVTMVKFETVKIEKTAEVNIILGQAHFIKTVEDLYEAVVGSVPGIKFGLAFSEASGACKVRVAGTDEDMKDLAARNCMAIGAGHCFIITLKNAFPINVLNAVKSVQEVCSVYCASANDVEVVLAAGAMGKGIMGVIDGESPKGMETPEDIAWRKDLLRKFGYKA